MCGRFRIGPSGSRMDLRLIHPLALACALSPPGADTARAMTLPLHLDERATFTLGIRNATPRFQP